MHRIVVAFAFASIAAAGIGRAEPILEPYAPFKLVGVMPDTQQALLWDDKAGEYRVARAGDDLDGWRVSGMDLKDARGPRVSLQKEELIDDLELVRMPRPGAVILWKDAAAAASRTAAPAPVAKPPAPPAPPAPDIEPTVIEDLGTPAPTTRPTPAPAPAPAAAAAPAPAAPPPPAYLATEESRTLARVDLDREINDFDNLMASVAVAKVEGGGFAITSLDPKSWVASLGYKQGDIVRRIAGQAVSSIEDAARVYARLRSLDSFTSEVDRGSQKVILKFAVKQ
jgi:hypothetical protein